MMPSKFLRCMDIWMEILDYFKIFLDSDEENVIKEKKKSIFTITLLSRELKEVGLNALWRDMVTLVPIVSVANSVNKLLEYRVSGQTGCWRICHPFYYPGYIASNGDHIINYLKRVRTLHLPIKAKELELLLLLSDILRHPPHILPALQNLCLLSTSETTTLPFLCLTSRLFSPSLTSISVKGIWGDSWETVHHFMVCSNMPKLTRLSFLQTYLPFFPYLGHCLAGLQEFSLLDDGRCFDLRLFRSIEIMQPSLRKLELSVSIESYPWEHKESVSFPTLRDLVLHICFPFDFNRFLEVVKISGLTDLKIIIRKDGGKEQLHLQSMIAAFPGLQCLYIRRMVPNLLIQYDWTLSYLAPLMEVRSMKSVSLVDIPHQLSKNGVLTLLESWPELHTLSITGSSTVFPSTLLTSLFKFPALRNLSLPFDFSSLESPLESDHTRHCASQLCKIFSPNSSGIPDLSHEKLHLLKKLQRMFPKLELISGTNKSILELGVLLETVNQLYK